jgi:nucleoside-diphosphate-sugar epimerase
LSDRLNLVTGATGLLGSHIAEQLTERGERVRALVRPSSNTSFLQSLGADLATGDLSDPESLRRAVAGVDVVYHCAAKVGDWGAWRLFQSLVIDATTNLLEACRHEKVGRVLHVSSITVYGHPKPRGELFTEDEPLGQNLWLWDYYCRAKIAAEEVCRRYPGDLTILRPSWIYGPRDRNSFPRILKAIQAGRVRVVGSGDNLLNIVYAGDVADAAIRAATTPKAVGQAYNISSAGEITQRQLLDLLTDSLEQPRVTRTVPFRRAFWLGFLSEIIGRVIRLKRPPHITRYAVGLIGRSTQFSTSKARSELGWQPQVPVEEGLKRTLAWWATSPPASSGFSRQARVATR